MMSFKRRVCVAITARPSYSRIRTALEHIAQFPFIDLEIFCSGSALLDRYGRIVDLIRADGFNVTEELFTYVEGNEPINMALTTANTIQTTAQALNRINPDLLFTIADRYETLGTAVACSYLGIPLIHVQGGEITGNIDDKVRNAVTQLADFHLVSNVHAATRVERMGGIRSAIHVTGCPSIDLAREALTLPLAHVQQALHQQGVADLFLDRGFIVVLQHPETDRHEQSFAQMSMTMDVVSRFGLPTLVFLPNVDAGADAASRAIQLFRNAGGTPSVHFVQNLEGTLFLRLLRQCACVVGNSSVGIRECAFLGTPVVNIGIRQQGRERASNVVDCDWDSLQISMALRQQLEQKRYPSSEIYGNGFAGMEIARVIGELT
jgi:UDP-hydrolysing UDP-N-acetyl-D-glucosamine 2-epimerase